MCDLCVLQDENMMWNGTLTSISVPLKYVSVRLRDWHTGQLLDSLAAQAGYSRRYFVMLHRRMRMLWHYSSKATPSAITIFWECHSSEGTASSRITIYLFSGVWHAERCAHLVTTDVMGDTTPWHLGCSGTARSMVSEYLQVWRHRCHASVSRAG